MARAPPKAAIYTGSGRSASAMAREPVAAATDLSQKMDLNFQAALAGQQDADMAQAILELTQAKTQQQASLSARAQMRKTSLFDFMG